MGLNETEDQPSLSRTSNPLTAKGANDDGLLQVQHRAHRFTVFNTTVESKKCMLIRVQSSSTRTALTVTFKLIKVLMNLLNRT